MSRKVLFLALALSLNIVFGGCLRWFMPAAKAKTELTEEEKKKSRKKKRRRRRKKKRRRNRKKKRKHLKQ